MAACLGMGMSGLAAACSVIGDYVRPSNFELVQIADAIVVATPEVAVGEDVVRFRVERTVKGAPPARFEVSMAAIGRTMPSSDDLSTSNPEGYAGPCNRMTFGRGGRYLFFLGRAADGSWDQLGFPFSRINEDYRGENAVWMRTVRRYLALQQRLEPMAQLDALRAALARGRDDEGLVLNAAERADIADHLASLSQWKPTAYLLRAFERVERGEAVELRPQAANQEGGDFDEIAALLLGEPPA